MIDLAKIAVKAISDAEIVADEISIDRPKKIEFYDQTTIIVTEKESVLNDEHADDEDEPTGDIYTTTLQIIVMAKDRATAKQVAFDAMKAALTALRSKVDRDNGPIWAVWKGNKSCGPASFGGVFLDCASASREIFVSNSTEP